MQEGVGLVIIKFFVAEFGQYVNKEHEINMFNLLRIIFVCRSLKGTLMKYRYQHY